MAFPSKTEVEHESLWRDVCRQKDGAYARLEGMVAEVCRPVLRRKGIPGSEMGELLQDVLVSIWQFAGRQRDCPRNLREFLKWRARGVFCKYVRRKIAERRAGDLRLPAEPGGEVVRPWDPLLLVELREAMADCRDRLDEKYRRVWIARIEEDMDTETTAEELGLSRGTVALHLHRAKDLLWECLEHKRVLS